MTDLQTRQRFIELRANNTSFDKIAKELKKSKPTLIDWSRELIEEIANHKALEIEAIQAEFALSIRARLQSKTIIYNKLREEAESRDYSEIPTEKVLDLLSIQEQRLKGELQEPQYRSAKEIEKSKADAEEWALL